jgi:hypothetical protein
MSTELFTPADYARLQAEPLRRMVDGIDLAMARAEEVHLPVRLALDLTVTGLETLRVAGVLIGCARPSEERNRYTGAVEAAHAWLWKGLEELGGTLDASAWPAQRARLLALITHLERGQGW